MQVGRGSLHGDFWWRRKELYCGMLGTVVLGRCCLSSYLFTKVRRGVWRVRAECWMVRLDDQDRLRVSCHILKNAGVDGASFAGHAEILPVLLFLSVIWVLSACENCSFKGPSHWECNALSSVFFCLHISCTTLAGLHYWRLWKTRHGKIGISAIVVANRIRLRRDIGGTPHHDTMALDTQRCREGL